MTNENPYRDDGGLPERAWDAGFAAGRAAEREATDEDAIRADERERLSARVYENGWCPTCAKPVDPPSDKCARCGGTGSLAPQVNGLLNFIRCPDCGGMRSVSPAPDQEDTDDQPDEDVTWPEGIDYAAAKGLHRPSPRKAFAEDVPDQERITHGRHCTCSACADEDWTNPQLAPCGMHGSSCPREYQPWGPAGCVCIPPRPDGHQ